MSLRTIKKERLDSRQKGGKDVDQMLQITATVVRSTAVGEVGTIRATGYPGTQE